MATANKIKEKIYFDEIYKQLEEMKSRVLILRDDLADTYGKDSPVLIGHDRHLLELAEYIDWKLQVLEKGTSFDWKTAKGIKPGIESDVSVQITTGSDYSGGYLGG
jgi:hypothetical protein